MHSSTATTTALANGVPAKLVTPKASPQPASKNEAPSSEHDHFFWSYTEEPHRTRRQAIIKAHPEVTKLCGPEPLTKYIVLAVISIQFFTAYLLRGSSPLSWPFLLSAYVVGATANQNLFLSIHEISHNLAFRSPIANRVFAIIANLPIAVPYSAAFRPYHLTHHKSLGVDGLDTDLPSAVEALLLDSVLGKAFFCTFQILFYALRPMFTYNLPITPLHLSNILTQLLFDYLIIRYLSASSLIYLILSSFLAGSLHPCAGHFIAEHYVLHPLQNAPTTTSSSDSATPVPETFSYYGPLNLLTYNVGLHNEHHDFPAVPWTRLPTLHAMANEFYKDLPQHRSWVGVMWQFVWDAEVGLWCRVKRTQGGRKVGTCAADRAAISAEGERIGGEEIGGGGGGGWRQDELGAGVGAEPAVPGLR
ncbi:MAG: hypothetical protein M1833_004899 [Piccolia ochrophora]|nr:MAG: hypothetical protein M1833_004899 [Piccolia ochrophora]